MKVVQFQVMVMGDLQCVWALTDDGKLWCSELPLEHIELATSNWRDNPQWRRVAGPKTK